MRGGCCELLDAVLTLHALATCPVDVDLTTAMNDQISICQQVVDPENILAVKALVGGAATYSAIPNEVRAVLERHDSL